MDALHAAMAGAWVGGLAILAVFLMRLPKVAGEGGRLAGGLALARFSALAVIAVAILVGTELVGASWAAGWALGGLFQLEPWISRTIEILFSIAGFVGLYFFMRTAIRNEPVRS